jgi:predicted ATPase/class 3 adenylate cyclase
LVSSRWRETEGIDQLADAAHALTARLPTGTVTFVFTDIEGSTRLLQELGGERYGAELERHRVRVRRATAAHGGVEVGTEGDAFFIAYARATDALASASDVQAVLADGPIRVRIGIHTGEALIVGGNYVGLDVHRAARICDAAHGGQVLVSAVTHELARNGLRDLGEYRLKDLTAPEHLFQLGAGEFPPPRTLRPTNLPVQPGPLLGRRKELGDLLDLAGANRLVTLTGAGGSGKTRLALELAAELSDEHQDGAWWVPLAAVADPGFVLPTIAQSLGARGELHEHLTGKRVLLLLDNLEQVLDCAPLIAGLLAGLPDLNIVATSRERLALSFEQEYPVPPLDQATAEELFVSRARQLEPDFEPDETVAEICLRLDRLPLALELASTRVKLMSTAQMLSRLEQRLDLLNKGKRDAPGRQATMRATIGWSYDLLPEAEQALFRGLGVFAGSFELEAAEAVCGAELDTLQSLIDKSLLRRDGHGRYFLLELTREYSLEQLRTEGEEWALSRRHADWFLRLASRADEHLMSAEQGRWLARLDADTDNLRAVLAWCSEHDPAAAIDLATTLFSPWHMHGRHRELITWLERALATPATIDARTRAVGLRTLGDAMNYREQYDKAPEPLEQSLALFRELGDASGEAAVLTILGICFGNQGSHAQAIELLEAALEISRVADDKLIAARTLNMLGGVLLMTGQFERSARAHEQASAIFTEVGWRSAGASNVGGLADVALAQGDPDRAERCGLDTLELVSGFGDERNEMYAVAQLACVAALRGNVHSAGRLWGVAESAENRLGMRMIKIERTWYERIITRLQNDQAFLAGYQAGLDIDLAEAVRELRELNESD